MGSWYDYAAITAKDLEQLCLSSSISEEGQEESKFLPGLFGVHAQDSEQSPVTAG